MPTRSLGLGGCFSPPSTWASSLGASLAAQPAQETISVKRANFKERFRTYQEFEKADWEPFDRLVDQELDQLLEEIHKPLEDNVAEGLRALTGK